MNGAQLALIAGGLFLAVKFGLFDKLMASFPGNTTGANPSNPPSGTSVNQSASTQTQSTTSGSGPTQTSSQTQNPQNPTPTPTVQTGTQPPPANAYGTGLDANSIALVEAAYQANPNDPNIIGQAAKGTQQGLYLARKYNWLFNPSVWNWYRSQVDPSWTGPAIPSLKNTPGLITVDQYLSALRTDGLAGLANNLGKVNTRKVMRYVQ